MLRRKVEKAARHPGVVIAAHGGDNVKTVFVPHIRQLVIRIGYVTWAAADGAAKSRWPQPGSRPASSRRCSLFHYLKSRAAALT